MPYRVIADHIRTCTFALADGETFSNEGRGYVLRRLLRRAMRYAQKLDLYEPFLYKLVDSVVDVMKCFYPYLVDKKEFVKKIIKGEEERFIKTLKNGETLLSEFIENKKELSGEEAFKLYDTFGFPIELTKEMCEDAGVTIDMDGFKECLNKQKELARASRKNIESFNKQSKDLLDFKEPSEYTYSDDTVEGKVIGLFKDGVKVDSIEDEGEVAFDVTNFYAEMGGQVADTGFIENKETRANVINVTKAPNKEHLHHVKVLYGSIKLGDRMSLNVDKNRHFSIMKNHSATHLLQSALIEVLGDECKQKGSFVNDEYLRFDFSFLRKIDSTEIKKIERKVNEFIKEGIEEKTVVLPIEEAKKLNAISLFDEKYGDSVRVVEFGDVSKEFCGGTHVKNTSDIGLFKIISEGSISSGVRRIEARTSLAAYEYLVNREDVLNSAEEFENVKTDAEFLPKLTALQSEINQEIAKNKTLLTKMANLYAKTLVGDLDNNGSVISYFDEFERDGLLNMIDALKANRTDYVICLIGNENGKHPLIVAVSDSNIKKGIKAGDIVKKISSVLGGNGGGRPNLAQGNVIDISKLSQINLKNLL